MVLRHLSSKAQGLFAVSCDKADDGFFAPESVELKDGHIPGNKPDVSPDNRAPKPGNETIVTMVVNADNFTILEAIVLQVHTALPEAGLLEVLGGEDQFTVFAPNDEAFEDLISFLTDAGRMDLLSNNEYLLDVLLYHVTEGRRAANSVVPKNGLREIETLLGESFYVNPWLSICKEPGSSMAFIVEANLSASNGIIHEIDGVLIPYIPAAP